ncbi:MAG: hypothetical protein UIM53_03760 [Acutalibacteraceae bacterium]|nr:hypothetical protein [Acutalibacteraceae bacterium]
MKEVTYEDWQKNPTPRMMWVWCNEDEEKKKRKVVYILSGIKGKKYNVLTVADKETYTTAYMHCAEIEKQRLMTNKELARWLREKPTREFKYDDNCDTVRCDYTYFETEADEDVDFNILIREDDGEWLSPLVEGDNV